MLNQLFPDESVQVEAMKLKGPGLLGRLLGGGGMFGTDTDTLVAAVADELEQRLVTHSLTPSLSTSR